MARPDEKAQAMLNKWTAMKRDHDKANLTPSSRASAGRDGKRPYLSSLCTDLGDAEFWRKQIIKEISKDVSAIQSSGMGEHQTRDLNDRINKTLREKHWWNKRILELKGPDFGRIERLAESKASEEEGGLGVKGNKGYQYFGAAKDLPGVRELFAANAKKMMNGDKDKGFGLYKKVGGDYYGFRDEEDGVLADVEGEAEAVLIEEEVSKRRKVEADHKDLGNTDSIEWQYSLTEAEDKAEDASLFGGVISHVPVPSQELIAKAMVEKKRAELISRLGE
jgi:pre-mRNA-splicing factor ISY1